MRAKQFLLLAKLKREGTPFLEGASIDLSSKLSPTYESNVNHYKGVHHSLSTLLLGIANTLALSKQISKLFFQRNVQVYSLLDQTEEERKMFL